MQEKLDELLKRVEALEEKQENREKKTKLTIKGGTAILTFDMDEQKEEFEQAVNAGNMANAIWDIQNDLWRPAFKHGYPDGEIADIIKQINSVLATTELKDQDGDPLTAESLISVLSGKFNEILDEHGVN